MGRIGRTGDGSLQHSRVGTFVAEGAADRRSAYDGMARQDAPLRRILIVDESREDRAIVRRHLLGDVQRQYAFTEVGDTEQAIGLCESAEEAFDCIIMGYHPSSLDGLAFLARLRGAGEGGTTTRGNARSQCAVVMLTGSGDEQVAVEAMKRGAQDYLTREHLSAGGLRRAVDGAIEKAALQRQVEEQRQALRVSESRLQLALDASSSGTFVWYVDEDRTESDPRMLDLFGLTPNGNLNLAEALAKLIHTDDREGYAAAVVKATDPNGSGELREDIRVVLPDGSQRWVAVAGRVAFDGDPLKAVHMVGMASDITERKRLERRTREALDALLQAAEELAASHGASEAWPGMASVAARLVALARRVLGCEIVSLAAIDPASGCFVPLATLGRSEEEQAAWYATLGKQRPEDYYSAEQLARLQAGEATVIDVLSAAAQGLPVYGTLSTAFAPLSITGTLEGVLSAAYAASDHRFTADELELTAGFARMALLVLQRERLIGEREAARAAAAIFEETTRQMDEFLSIASHELRTPLTSLTANVQIAIRQLRGLTSAIEEDAANAADPFRTPAETQARLERSEMLLERSGRQLARMDRLVGDLIDTSRIQAGKLELRPEPHDLAEIVREVASEQGSAWPGREIVLDLPPHMGFPVHADADRIGQVMSNYLSNALKYSPPDAPIMVRAGRTEDSVRVETCDKGPGLSAEQCTHVFERFYRAPNIKQQNGSGIGLGLGLYISKNIIERHGGTLGVESVPGEGSCFWFKLPLALSGT